MRNQKLIKYTFYITGFVINRSQKRKWKVKFLKIIIAIILPPLAAFLQVGATKHFWINIILTLLMAVPGIIHALWLVLTDKK